MFTLLRWKQIKWQHILLYSSNTRDTVGRSQRHSSLLVIVAGFLVGGVVGGSGGFLRQGFSV